MKPLAVIDVETTGLNPYRLDRVVEVAVVLVVPGQGISAELTTLVNPERDIGPTSVHGLTASDIINAPRFAQIAGHLAEFLCGSIALVGHNVRFDVSFLQSEYGRIGVEMPRYASLDTMALAGGGTLSACCTEHGIEYHGKAHAALHDARATAGLLQRMLLDGWGQSYIIHFTHREKYDRLWIWRGSCESNMRELSTISPPGETKEKRYSGIQKTARD